MPLDTTEVDSVAIAGRTDEEVWRNRAVCHDGTMYWGIFIHPTKHAAVAAFERTKRLHTWWLMAGEVWLKDCDVSRVEQIQII